MHFIFNSKTYRKYNKIININIAERNLIKQNTRAFFCVLGLHYQLEVSTDLFCFFNHQMIKLTFCIFVLEFQSFFFKTSVFLYNEHNDDNQTSDDDRGDDTDDNRRDIQGVFFIDNTFFRSTNINCQIEMRISVQIIYK